jgi:hypothetical protein
MPSLVLPSRLWDGLDLSTEIAIFQTVQSKLFATRNAIGLLVDIVSDAHGSAVSIAQPEAAALVRAGWRRRRPASAKREPSSCATIANNSLIPSRPCAAVMPNSAKCARNALINWVRWRISRLRARCSFN